MMFWRSVVFKLWFTILLLVLIVLSVLTVMLLSFFEQYHKDQTSTGLTNTANKIASIAEKQDENVATNIIWDLLDNSTGATIVYSKNDYTVSKNKQAPYLPLSFILSQKQLKGVMDKGKSTVVITSLSPIQKGKDGQMVIVGVPMIKDGETAGAVYIYQSLEVLKETTNSTKKFIVLAACVAIVLTTVFAFFLVTRITAPLRIMKNAAFAVAKGNFDTKIPILTHDEIGDLARAFNEMGKQLNFHITALNQEKEQLGSILSGMVDGVITFDRDGEVVITNPPAEKFLQYWKHERREHYQTVPPTMMRLFAQVVTTGKEQVGEVSFQSHYWVIIITPLHDDDSIRGAIAVIRDMTEERRLDKMRIDFITNVSHELRTPISMVQGYSEAIVDDIAQTKEEQKEMAQIIYDESLRMGRLVHELLDLAKMEAGHLQLSKEELEIYPFLHKILRKFQGLVKEKEILLEDEISVTNAFFLLDADRMEQVLTNILDNCIRHTNTGGKVMLYCNDDDAGLTIEIKDTGIGISEEDLPFIFERFYKADKARKRGDAGTGLGLAIAKNIIDAHHGVINVQSVLGRGTTFSIFIPRNYGE